jgi:molecular chaperone GrpE
MSDDAVPESGVPEEPHAGPEQPVPPDDAPAVRIDELEDRWRRALADLDNYRKRAAGVLEREIAAEHARTSAAWLPVLDDLERALEHADAEPGAVIQGVRTVLDEARQVIERLGYPRRDDEGEPFDPALHEAIGTVPGTGADEGTVVRVVRPGYGSGRSPLRPAQVLVAKGHDDGPGP